MPEQSNDQITILPSDADTIPVGEQQLTYHFEVYDGPLDLLLTLVVKNKIDIYDIAIAELLEQYMEQIERMRENEMDIASEFLEMASRLVYIKSAMLLPKYEEEAEDLKKELSGQLIEYQMCREIARMLAPMVDFDTFVKPPSKVDFDMTYNRIHDPFDISAAYVSAVGRGQRKLPPDRSAFAGIVSKKIVSVSSRIIHVMRRLWHGRTVTYGELFTASSGRSELVATFLAVLELVKGKRVRIEGDGDEAVVSMVEKSK
ncbi:segregation and condensation protein A [Ruminococcus sp.]|uniref:segregation and condensation protein A n=1 Tax=Ruminococcus sp. TaxID=41978 RepID=UPI00388E302D